ncbi:MAG: hypothetical protein ABIH34_02075 [Nanoarchaeota archaeon]
MKKTFAITAMMVIAIVGLVSAGGWMNKDAWNAVENDDFPGWKAAKEAQITEENFQMARERHADMPEGMRERKEAHMQLYEFVEAGDFQGWKEALENAEITPQFDINEETFNVMVEMHTAKENGDFEKMQELEEEYGFGKGMGKGRGMHKGQGSCPFAK